MKKTDRIFASFVFLCLLLCFTPLFAQDESPNPPPEKKESLTTEELLKSEAGRLFVARRYEEALREFRALSRQYPDNLAVKRYIGACLDHLRQDEEAAAAFQEVLKLNPEDLPTHQFLGKIYLRMGRLDQAEKEFNFIVDHDQTGMFQSSAKNQLEAIQRLHEGGKGGEGAGRQISPQEFLKTPAAQAFMSAQYEKALEELEMLQARYPQDVLVNRYRGLTLDKLKRYDEAINSYESGLKIVPENAALHYFLGQTYLHQQDYEKAEQEMELVTQYDEEGVYGQRAKRELPAIGQLIRALKKAKKKWSLSASGGVEYNSNATSNSRVPAFRSTADQSAFKYSLSAGGDYKLFDKNNYSGELNYDYLQDLYDDSLSQIDLFYNIWGGSVSYTRPVWGRPLLFQMGHSVAHAIVRNFYYSTGNSTSGTLVYSLKDWWRVSLSEKLTFTSYASEGSSSDHTSRDGYSNVVGVVNYFYHNKKRNFYTLLGFDVQKDDTQGVNYRKDEYVGRSGLHFPLLWKWEGDLSLKYKDSNYPKFGFPARSPDRHDHQFTFKTTLQRKLGENWTLKGAYTYVNSFSQNDTYTYTNHASGFSLSYSY